MLTDYTVLMRLLFLIVLVYAFSQIAGRLRKNVANTKGIKTEFQSAIADAKNRLPSTGLFQLLKGEASNSKIIEETVEKLVEVVTDELKEIQEKYKDDRRTEIQESSA